MESKDFDLILEKRLQAIKETLASKAKEYAKGDRLHNFKRAALLQKTIPEKALMGMASKHIVSVLDIVDDIADGLLPTVGTINEKIGDTINYLCLLEALILERLGNVPKSNVPESDVSISTISITDAFILNHKNHSEDATKYGIANHENS